MLGASLSQPGEPQTDQGHRGLCVISLDELCEKMLGGFW